jgi:hypothetical protein
MQNFSRYIPLLHALLCALPRVLGQGLVRHSHTHRARAKRKSVRLVRAPACACARDGLSNLRIAHVRLEVAGQQFTSLTHALRTEFSDTEIEHATDRGLCTQDSLLLACMHLGRNCQTKAAGVNTRLSYN